MGVNVESHRRDTAPAGGKRSFSLGGWVLTPRTWAKLLKVSPYARIERDNECVTLRHCSADLERFASEIVLIQAESKRRFAALASSPAGRPGNESVRAQF